MTENDYAREVVLDMLGGWITLARYVELSGETRDAVHMRVHRKVWQVGVHYIAPPGCGAWVNAAAVGRWLEEQAEKAKGTEVPLPDSQPAE